MTGGMRSSVMALAVFFVISLIAISVVKIQRMQSEATVA
jgi:hypothetical protein